MTQNYVLMLVKKYIVEVLKSIKEDEGIKRFKLWNAVYEHIRYISMSESERAIFNDLFSDITHTDTLLRRIVSDLKMFGYPIGSSVSRGYFMIKNQSDYADAVQTYKSKIFGMWEIVKRIKINAEKSLGKQMFVDFEIAEKKEEERKNGI